MKYEPMPVTRTRLEDMRDFCEGEPSNRPHPSNVARLCRDVMAREERRAEITDDIRQTIFELEKCPGAPVSAERVIQMLKGIVGQLDGKDEPGYIDVGDD